MMQGMPDSVLYVRATEMSEENKEVTPEVTEAVVD